MNLARLAPGPDRRYFPLPSPSMTMMLKALVGPSGERQANWRAWAAGNDPLLDRLRAEESDRLRALLPIIATTAELLPCLDGTEQTAVRVATAREDLRYQAIRSIMHDVGSALDQAGVAYMALDGVAVADTYWPQPHVRHSGGCRFVVPSGSVQVAVDAILMDADFTTDGDPDHAMSASHQVITHQTELFFVVADHSTDGWQSVGIAPVPTLGAELKVPSPTDQLCATLASVATYGSGASVLGVLDATYILRQAEVDWDLAARRWRAHPAGRHVQTLLHYLRSQVGIPRIPLDAVADVRLTDHPETRSDFESLVWAARHTRKWHPGRIIWSAPTVTGRVKRFVWLAMRKFGIGGRRAAGRW